MRHRARLAAVLFLAVAAMGAQAVGCVDRYDPVEGCEDPAGCTTGSGTGGQPDPAKNCDLTDKNSSPDGSCGVFVRSSAAAGGTGSKEQPFQTFAEAAAKRPKRVYVCGEIRETYAEKAGVTFTDGVKIYGGFTACDGAWTWSPEARATLQGPVDPMALKLADAIALKLNGGANRLENLDIIAEDASDADDDSPGKSSIALLANGGTVYIVNATLKSSNATGGAAATLPAGDLPPDGIDGAPGVPACSLGPGQVGPAGPITRCTNGQSAGGKGGNSGVVSGFPGAYEFSDAMPGESGAPSTSEAPAGSRGDGQTSTAPCTKGMDGADGPAGTSAASSDDGLGSIHPDGYKGALANLGGKGEPGRGGGGGGGARGGNTTNCPNGTTVGVGGASGGSGGSGGCGGRGGPGGHAGGSSIVLIAVDAAITLEDVKLVAGDGGDGGLGGVGEAGGKGSEGGGVGDGDGTSAIKASCSGGGGGKGGDGGPGGGGHGGHSLGVALHRGKLQQIHPRPFTPGNHGKGGMGGPRASADQSDGAPGANGYVQECWDFAKNEACSAASPSQPDN